MPVVVREKNIEPTNSEAYLPLADSRMKTKAHSFRQDKKKAGPGSELVMNSRWRRIIWQLLILLLMMLISTGLIAVLQLITHGKVNW
jgi:hypothetical protein